MSCSVTQCLVLLLHHSLPQLLFFICTSSNWLCPFLPQIPQLIVEFSSGFTNLDCFLSLVFLGLSFFFTTLLLNFVISPSIYNVSFTTGTVFFSKILFWLPHMWTAATLFLRIHSKSLSWWSLQCATASTQGHWNSCHFLQEVHLLSLTSTTWVTLSATPAQKSLVTLNTLLPTSFSETPQVAEFSHLSCRMLRTFGATSALAFSIIFFLKSDILFDIVWRMTSMASNHDDEHASPSDWFMDSEALDDVMPNQGG